MVGNTLEEKERAGGERGKGWVGGWPLFEDPSLANSTTMHSRVFCQDMNLSLLRYSLFDRSGKPLLLIMEF